MKVPMTVEYLDGTTAEVTPSPLAMIGWEKWSGRKMTDLGSATGGMGMGDMCRMAWEQLHLAGLTTEEYEAWCATLSDLSPVGEAEDPTSGGEAR